VNVVVTSCCNISWRCKCVQKSHIYDHRGFYRSCGVIFGYRRVSRHGRENQRTVIPACERSLMLDYTGKPCCGRETARCRCKIRYVSKCTASGIARSSLRQRGFLCYYCHYYHHWMFDNNQRRL